MFGPLLESEMSSFEKVHAVVARSRFRSQNVQNTPCSDHFWSLRCRVLKKCTPLWREAQFQVKMYKTHHARTTFGGSDVASLRFASLHYTTLFVLKILKDHSTWPILKRTDDEEERRAYLHLWRECKHYDPGWEHVEMEVRKSRLRQPDVTGSAEADVFRFQ